MLDRCKLRVLVAVLALTVSAPAAAAGSKPRVVLGPVGGDRIGPELKEKLGVAVTRGMQAAGADMVTDAAAVEPGCEAACLTAAAGKVGASHVVRGNVEVQGSHYRIRLEMIDGSTGQVVDSREDACEICTEREVSEVVEIGASALKASVFKRLSRAAAEPAISPPLSPAAPAATPEASLVPPTSAAGTQPADASHLKRWWPWVAIGAGAAAAVAGAWLLAIDGQGTCDQSLQGQECSSFYSTAGGGIALVTAGAIAAATGGFVLVFGSGSDRETSVALGPGGVLLRGKF